MTPNYLWNTDFFEWAKNEPDNSIDTIITDPPYTSFRNKLGENSIKDKTFDLKKFCDECLRLLKPENSLFISFCSIYLMKDYFEFFKNKIPFKCEQIWDKRPTRSWISYSLPLRHLEYIIYFGKGKIDFRKKDISELKKAYKRTQFGGSLRDTNKNTKKFSQGQFEQILEDFPVFRKGNRTNQSQRKPNQKKLITSEFGEDLTIQNSKKKIGIIENHPTKKSPKFSEYFEEIIVNPGLVLDPCCGTGALICSFKDAIGIDITQWQPVKIEKQKAKQTKLFDY